jgi:hypothetical protein
MALSKNSPAVAINLLQVVLVQPEFFIGTPDYICLLNAAT